MLDGTRQQVLCYHTFMASRKPKGIADDIVGGIRNIVSPWLGTPPGELKQVTQFKQATRVAAEGLDQTFAGGMIKAGTQGNKALVQQAAVNAAALGTGYVAGKVAVTVANAFKLAKDSPRLTRQAHSRRIASAKPNSKSGLNELSEYCSTEPIKRSNSCAVTAGSGRRPTK